MRHISQPAQEMTAEKSVDSQKRERERAGLGEKPLEMEEGKG